ncbi:MAG: chromosome segregation protein SMC [Oscillospiraceae bacterium]|nr:chromosome segregation protein SMC [Oscillospiraceae bacterium]
MRLKGIETQGFKSFPDRTKLEFNEGITAIVGPNGSGKSNISDAVRWVFGEQSNKTLRAAKSEDVIFGGTQSRKPQGFAWVSLIIDNSDRSLNVENDEVTVTRKLYRSGESEYRINGNLVRMRDVVELFLDTGLGRDGYSIIGQGRIAEIVGAKSTQRREIFEEAAGIAKYRLRKTEAERRLQSAEDNMVRLRDILGELEGRVEPLRIQSEKASQFIVYAEEKKALEISLWMERLDKLQDQLKTQEDKLLVCRSDRDAIQARLEELESAIDGVFSQQQEIIIYIDNHRSTIKALEDSLSHAETEIAVMENNILHANQEIERIRAELEGAGLAESDLDQRIAEKQAAIVEKQAAIEAKRSEMLAAAQTIQDSKGELAALATKTEGLKSQRFELRESVNNARQTNASSQSLIEDTAERIRLLKETSAQKDENLNRLNSELQDCEGFIAELQENIAGLENSHKGYSLKLGSREEKLQTLQQQQSQLDRKAGELLQRAQLLSDMENSLEGFGHSVKFIMKSSLRGIIGPVSSLITTEDKYATAIEIALGAAMQNIVVENEAVAKQAISQLKQSKSGRCTFLPVTTIKGSRLADNAASSKAGYVGVAADLVKADKRYSGIIDSLLGRIVIAENIDLAVEIARSGSYKFRVVTLDGQVVNAGGSLTGGYVAKSAGILGRRSEIERLRAEAAEYAKKSKEMEDAIQVASNELASIKSSITAVEAERKTAGEDLIGAQAELRRLTLSRDEALETHRRAESDYQEMCDRLEELQQKCSSSEDTIIALTGELENIEKEIAADAARREELSAQVEQSGERYGALQVDFVALGKDLELLSDGMNGLTAQKEGQHQRLSALQEQISGKEAEIAQVRQDIEDRRSRTEQERQRVETLNREIAERSATRMELEQQVTQLRQQERESNNTREQVMAELTRLEERHSTINADFDGIVSKLWDEYELSRSQAREAAIKLEDVQAAQKRLSELKNRIKSLGHVNLAAIEEYKEVAERYEFLHSQVEDVEKSKKELSGIIADLTKDMCAIFREKFDRINEEFGKVFVELFGGGRGRLELADPENILESGIDIFVQPPGKLIKNLSSLSGGEQAFVAIAIYFAILKVSPAPFCLMDEIEAALDDVNVVRFASYMRNMTAKTQFITITHRRGTMEEADVLYGVTMQEEGVSKILRLDVDEIESKLGIK